MRAGQDPARFPDYSLREAAVILEAAAARDVELAHLAATFNSYAHHAPDKMPDPRGEKRRERERPMSPAMQEADRIAAKAALKAMARRGKKHGD